jgi:hypothetical protein
MNSGVKLEDLMGVYMVGENYKVDIPFCVLSPELEKM